MVLCFAFPAYRRTKMKAFAFLIWGSAIGIVLEAGLQLHRNSPYTSTEDEQTILECYRVGYLICSVLWGIGIVQLINFVMAGIEKKEKDKE